VGACFDAFFFAMGHLIALSPKKIYEIPLPLKQFTLFYTYIVLHGLK
jgi:hypothetical protein